jgi:K+-sensing histidine kinase KdpD
VDLSALAESVIAELPWLDAPRRCSGCSQPGLHARCSAPLARVVLINLLGNAAKFTARRGRAAHQFSRDDAATTAPCGHRDNGAGFDAGAPTTLFQPFVRLHRSEQFQGTGSGCRSCAASSSAMAAAWRPAASPARCALRLPLRAAAHRRRAAAGQQDLGVRNRSA